MNATNATSRNCVEQPNDLIDSIAGTIGELAIADSSKKRYCRAMEVAFQDMGGIDPVEWDENQLREWAKKVRERAPGSAAIEFSAMKAYLMVKGRNDLLGIAWVWKLKGLGESKRLRDIGKRMIPANELETLLESLYKEIENPKCSWTRTKRIAITLTFAETGIRAVGAQHLRVKDLDFERNRVHIERTKRAKTRTLPVDLHYMVAMRRYLDARNERIEEKGYPKELLDGNAPLFFIDTGKRFGEPLHTTTLSSAAANECKKVLGTSYFSHAFRHAKATRLLREGFSEKQVQEYMGHTNFATTSVYVHLTDDDLDKAYRTRNGNGDMGMEKKKASNPNDPVEAAIEALTEQFIKGNIDPERYAAAVKALKQ